MTETLTLEVAGQGSTGAFVAVDDTVQAEVLDLTMEVLEVDSIFTEVELGRLKLIESYVPVVESSSTVHRVAEVTACSHTIVLNQVAHLRMELQVAFCVRSIVRNIGDHLLRDLVNGWAICAFVTSNLRSG